MKAPDRMFAVIPAAGLSRRMGQPKLMLTLGGVTVIERLLNALDQPAITMRHVVVRSDDVALQNEVSRVGGSLVIPEINPPDMRASVTLALNTIEHDFAPTDDDGWLLVPADHPVLDQRLIAQMMEFWQVERPQILVPRCGQRRGHPTFFRWNLARKVRQIPTNRGLNWLLREYADAVTELPVETESAITDLDTPDDYARLRAMWETHES